MPPLRELGIQGIFIRVIEMHRHHQSAFRPVFGQCQVLQGQIRIGAIAGDAQETVVILPTHGTNGIHKHLIPLVEDGILLALVIQVVSPSPSAIVDFVHRFEYQELPFVLELLGYLCPHGLELCLDAIVRLLAGRSPLDAQPILAIRPVVVKVDDDVQLGILGISHHVHHPIQPCLVDAIIRCFAHLPQPCHGDAYRRDACLRQLIEGLLGGLSVSPTRFIGHTIYMRIELIAQVPPQSQLASHIPGIPLAFFLRLRFDGRCYRFFRYYRLNRLHGFFISSRTGHGQKDKCHLDNL